MTKRNVWLLILSVLVGPLIGSGAFMAGTTLFDWLFAGGGPGAFSFLVEYWPIILSAGYTFGFLPALVFALVMAWLSPRIPSVGARLGTATLVGAFASLAIIGFFVVGGFAGIADSLYILVAVFLTGGIAGSVCMAVIEWLHPLPEPAPAAS
jgi:hypothetical protein